MQKIYLSAFEIIENRLDFMSRESEDWSWSTARYETLMELRGFCLRKIKEAVND
jgi:hypothetical protein